MNADDARALWCRFLAGEELSADEQRGLVDAMEADPALRQALLDDGALDGMLRGIAAARRTGDAFVRTLADCVAPERDATRFVRKVEQALAQPAPRPPSSTTLAAIRDSRSARFTRRLTRPEPGAIAWKVGAAAAVFFTLIVVAAAARPSKTSSSVARIRPEPVIEAPAPEPTPLPGLPRKPAPAPAAPKGGQAPLPKGEVEPPGGPQPFEIPPKAVAKQPEAPRSELPQPPAPAPKAEKSSVAKAREAAAMVEGVSFATKPSVEQYLKGQELPDDVDLVAHRSDGSSIEWKDGTRVDFQPGTEFRIVRDEQARRLLIVKGTIDSRIAKQAEDRPMIFVTPHAEARILGTTIRLTASPDAVLGTTLEVREGKVRFGKPGGKPVDVGVGQFASASPTTEPLSSRDVFQGAEEIRIVFGPADTAVAGYKTDSGQVFDPARGYGWVPTTNLAHPWKDRTGIARVDQAGANVGRRPVFPLNSVKAHHVTAGWGVYKENWRLPLPNGNYEVTVVVGDHTGDQGPHRVAFEGIVAVNDVFTRKQPFFHERTVPVAVRDGELTMTVGGVQTAEVSADNTADTILNQLIIRRAIKK